jgi:hypothetical protein
MEYLLEQEPEHKLILIYIYNIIYIMNINDNRFSFKSKSISNYNKNQLFIAFKTTILNKLYNESVYFFHEIYVSGYYKELYEFYINFFILYIHASNNSLLKLIYDRYNKFLDIKKTYSTNNIYLIKLRDSEKFLNDLFDIFKNIYFSIKYDYVKLVPPYFTKNTNNMKIVKLNGRKFINNGSVIKEILETSDTNQIRVNLSNFQKYLNKLYKKNYKINHEFEYLKNKTFYWFSKFIIDEFYESSLKISSTRLTIKYEPNNKIIKDFIPQMWNIILNTASQDKLIFDQLRILYYFDSKNIVCSKMVLTISLLFFIINPNKTNFKIINMDSNDKQILQQLTNNINISLNNKMERNDFISLSNNNKKKKKNQVNKINKLHKNNIINNKVKQIIKDNPKKKENKVEKIEKKETEVDIHLKELFDNIDNIVYEEIDPNFKPTKENFVDEYKKVDNFFDKKSSNNNGPNIIIKKVN